MPSAFVRALAPVLLLSSCVYSIDSAITEGEATSEPGMVGTWHAEGDTVVIRAEKGGSYRVTYRDDGDTAELAGRTGRIGGRRLLELTPLLPGPDAKEEDWPMARMHLVLDIRPDEIRTQRIDPKPLIALAATNPAAVPHIRRGDDVILTAPKAALVPALRQHFERPGALTDASVWRRVGQAPPRD